MPLNFEAPSEPVKIVLDGKEYRLRYSNRTLKRIKDDLGISFMRMTGFDSVDEDKLPKLLHYGLERYHPEVNLEDLDDMMDAAANQYTLGCIIHAATGQDPKNAVRSQQTTDQTSN